MGVTQGTKHYEYPSSKPTPQKKPKPKKKLSKKIPIQPNITEDSATTGNKPKYVNMDGIEQSLTTATKNNEYTNVGYMSEQPSRLNYCMFYLLYLVLYTAGFVFVYFSEI